MIHLDLLNISQLDDRVYSQLYPLVSPQRQARADKCQKTFDALRLVAAEFLVLRAFHSCHPGASRPEFSANSYGKPYFSHDPEFHFNLSHSGDWVVLAWGNVPVGVDVQKMEPGKDSLARRYYTEDEQAWVFAPDTPEARLRRFYEVWTAKESYLKHQGTGINRPLNHFSVLELPGISYHHPDPNHCLCLCAEDPHRTIRLCSAADFHL